MTRNSVAAVVIAISMVAARPAAGQSIGASLAGVVHDESGARLPGVTFTLTNTANGRTQTVISDARGEFRAVALQPRRIVSRRNTPDSHVWNRTSR